jgi:hypothetical protein
VDWWAGSKTIIASVAASPLQLDIHLENQCESDSSAERIANRFKAILAILQAVPQADTARPDYGPLLAAVTIRQSGKSVYLDWKWDLRMLALLTGDAR